MLRYINLNQLFSKGLYIFTLNDNISNVPPTFTEDNGFCFLFTVVIDPNSGVAGDDEVTQFIYQYNGVNTGSGLYTRTAPSSIGKATSLYPTGHSYPNDQPNTRHRSITHA